MSKVVIKKTFDKPDKVYQLNDLSSFKTYDKIFVKNDSRERAEINGSDGEHGYVTRHFFVANDKLYEGLMGEAELEDELSFKYPEATWREDFFSRELLAKLVGHFAKDYRKVSYVEFDKEDFRYIKQILPRKKGQDDNTSGKLWFEDDMVVGIDENGDVEVQCEARCDHLTGWHFNANWMYHLGLYKGEVLITKDEKSCALHMERDGYHVFLMALKGEGRG